MGGSSHSTTTVIHEENLSPLITEMLKKCWELEEEILIMNSQLDQNKVNLAQARLRLDAQTQKFALEKKLLDVIYNDLKEIQKKDLAELQVYSGMAFKAPTPEARIQFFRSLKTVTYPSSEEVMTAFKKLVGTKTFAKN